MEPTVGSQAATAAACWLKRPTAYVKVGLIQRRALWKARMGAFVSHRTTLRHSASGLQRLAHDFRRKGPDDDALVWQRDPRFLLTTIIHLIE
jgi:hypothetical protein